MWNIEAFIHTRATARVRSLALGAHWCTRASNTTKKRLEQEIRRDP
jgi:hypothetical protein